MSSRRLSPARFESTPGASAMRVLPTAAQRGSSRRAARRAGRKGQAQKGTLKQRGELAEMLDCKPGVGLTEAGSVLA